MSAHWNPWHGCHRVSEGCRNCYVFRIDGAHGRDGGEVGINADFLLPLRQTRTGEPRIESGETVYTCFSSDFLLEEADEWRGEAWQMMRARPDLRFVFFTKRIQRFSRALPSDWGTGYPNVVIGCTCENQARADERLPEFLSLPIARRMIVCEPLLGPLDLSPYLDRTRIDEVSVGGESGDSARPCDFAWVERIAADCRASGVRFSYHQTGALLFKDARFYRIPRSEQARQAKLAQQELLKKSY